MLTLPRNRVCKHRYVELPSTKHVPKIEERGIIHWFGKDIRKLLFCRNVFHMNIPSRMVGTPYTTPEVMILDRDVFSSRSELEGLGHCNSG